MAHILIIDDDELIAQIATEILIDAGHACGWVTNGEEAWTLLNKGKRPNLVLMDQDLPGISGISLVRKVRQSPDLYDLPVIMFTAMSGEDDEAQAIYAGAQDFIRKPFEPKMLITCVDRLLSKRLAATDHKPLTVWLAESNGMLDENSQDFAKRRVV